MYHVKHANRFTEFAKNKLEASSYAECRKIAESVAIGKNNDEELVEHITRQDVLRKIDYKDYFNLDPNFSKNSEAKRL